MNVLTRFSFALLVLIIFQTVSVRAQSTTILGVEFGPKWDRYQVEEKESSVYTRPFFHAPIFGLTLAQEFGGQFRFETGFYVVNYGKSYRIRENKLAVGISSALDSYQIPLRLKLNLRPGGGSFHILPMLGYVFGFNLNYTSSGTGYGCMGAPCLGGTGDSTVVRDTTDYGLARVFQLIQFGLGFEYQINDGPIFSLTGTYSSGLKRIVDMNVSYWSGGQPERRANVFSTGGYWSVSAGVAYPISRIWQGGAKVERDWER